MKRVLPPFVLVTTLLNFAFAVSTQAAEPAAKPAPAAASPATTASDVPKPVSDENALAALLPAGPEGWEPDVKNYHGDIAGHKTVVAEGTYLKEGSEGVTALVRITDYNSQKSALDEVQKVWKGTDEKDESSYKKGVTVQGYPGYEEADSTQRRSSLTLVVASRYSVEIILEGQLPGELAKWLGYLNLKKLESLK